MNDIDDVGPFFPTRSDESLDDRDLLVKVSDAFFALIREATLAIEALRRTSKSGGELGCFEEESFDVGREGRYQKVEWDRSNFGGVGFGFESDDDLLLDGFGFGLGLDGLGFDGLGFGGRRRRRGRGLDSSSFARQSDSRSGDASRGRSSSFGHSREDEDGSPRKRGKEREGVEGQL